MMGANNESEVVDILLHVTFYFNSSTMLDNVKNFWRFVICMLGNSHQGKRQLRLRNSPVLKKKETIRFDPWHVSYEN